jgi:hypothetical protein
MASDSGRVAPDLASHDLRYDWLTDAELTRKRSLLFASRRTTPDLADVCPGDLRGPVPFTGHPGTRAHFRAICEMSPLLPVDGFADRRLRYAVFACERGLSLAICVPPLAIRDDLGCQLRRPASLTTRGSTVPHHVGHVLQPRAVTQVDEPVIHCPARSVQRLHARRTRTNESLQHELMHETALGFPLPVKSNGQVPGAQARSQYAASFAAPATSVETAHAAEITDLVQAFIARDRKPSLSRVIHSHTSNVVRPGCCVDAHSRAAFHFTGGSR